MKDAWKPIETAPKDSRVLLFWPSFWSGKEHIEAGKWDHDQYAQRPKPYWSGDQERLFGVRAYRQDSPTHWQALEAPVGVTPSRAALARFIEGTSDRAEMNPLERLRYFCSLAMNGQDWLDAEPLFKELERTRGVQGTLKESGND